MKISYFDQTTEVVKLHEYALYIDFLPWLDIQKKKMHETTSETVPLPIPISWK